MSVSELINNYLSKINCCSICCVRYLKSCGQSYEDTKRKILEIWEETMLGFRNEKREKNDALCVACLGLFFSPLIDEIVERIDYISGQKNYESPEFSVTLNFPLILQIRQMSIWFALIKEFGSKISMEQQPDFAIKEALRIILLPIIKPRLKKNPGSNGISFNLEFDHLENATSINQIHNNQTHGKRKIEITKNSFEKYYNPKILDINIVEKYLQIPPDIVKTQIYLKDTAIYGPTIYVAGRYRKLSRKLSHSPWILEGKRVLEDSIQELIIEKVAPQFGVPESSIVFSSSGREDIDVRCLGKGRPFALEIPDSKRISLSTSLAKKIEEEIEKSEKVSVIHLQIVLKNDLIHLRTGEEHKTKCYRALCILDEIPTYQTLLKLNEIGCLKIKQKTPIRVLHRRSLKTRERTIFSIKGKVCKTHAKVIVLDIETQAGTYVKELIHGEFGRTSPSIASIIGQNVDIMALDVMKINLDWPTEKNNRIDAD